MVPRSQPQNLPRPTLTDRALSSNSAKPSFQSHSSSFEADDEHSSSADQNMGPDYGLRDGPSQYEGEDTRLTSKKELWGWYSYGFAAEVFIVCGMGSFIPICLESLAREKGVLLSDKTTPCGASSHSSSGLAPRVKDDQCVIYILGVQVNTASFAMYTFSLSVLFQAILVVSISCAADHGNYRKRLLLFFAYCGALAMMLFLFIVPDVYLLGALLAVIANTFAGASFVLLNSFLPLLVRHHPTTQFQSVDSTPEFRSTEPDDGLPEHTLLDSTAALLPSISADNTTPLPPAKNLTSIELQLSTQISSKGIGIGYAASLFLQCVSITILWILSSRYKTTFPLRVILFLIGAWWMIGSIPTALWLRPRPGPPLPSTDPSNPNAKRTWLAYIIYAWASLWRTIKLARRLKDIVLFLLAWFLLSDAIATVSGTAVLYAKTTLHMKNEALGLINVIVTTCGVLGAFSWAFLSRFFGLRPHQTILVCICIFELIPLYGLLGYLPIVKRWGVIGLQKDWEMYPLGAVYGFVLGGLSSYCRSLFGELIPPGSEAAFYALYAITDKGSSVFGPAIVGLIVDRFGEIRPAFLFLAVLVGVPGPIIYFVNVERGKAEGIKLAAVIEGFSSRESAEASEHGEGDNLLASGEEDREDYIRTRRDE